MLDTFDIAIEISRVKLLDYVLQNVLYASLPVVPKLTMKASGLSGRLQAIVDGVDLSLDVGSDRGTLVYHVYGAIAATSTQSQVGFTDGEIRLGLQFIPGTPLKAIFTTAEFKTSQTTQLVDPSAFFKDMGNLLTSILDTHTQWDLFPNTPDATATLMIALAFNSKVVCLNSDTVAITVGNGDITKLGNFLGLEDFGIALSTDRVKNTLLFPAMLTLVDAQDVANGLGLTLSQADALLQNPTISFINSMKPFLPAPFGTGSVKQTVQGVDIFYDFIDFALNNGSIEMTGKFRAEAFCAHVNDGQFAEQITLAIADQQVASTFLPNPPQPVYSVQFDFWCGFGFFFLASNFELGAGYVVTAVGIAIGTGIQVQQPPLSTSPFAAPAFDQVTWESIGVFTDGMVLRGSSTASVGYDVTLSRVDINSAIFPGGIQDVGSGTYHFPGSSACQPADFKYEEYRQDIVVSLSLHPTLLLSPTKTTWVVHGQPITAGSGQITYTDLAHAATPPFNEAALPNHGIEIDYAVNPGVIILKEPGGLSTLQLTMPRGDYNFNVLVGATVIDGDGHSYFAQVGLGISTDIVQFGQDFADFQKKCGLASKINIGKLKTLPQNVVRGGDPLTPTQVTNVVREVVDHAQSREAFAIVKSLGGAYGGETVLRAFDAGVGARIELKT